MFLLGHPVARFTFRVVEFDVMEIGPFLSPVTELNEERASRDSGPTLGNCAKTGNAVNIPPLNRIQVEFPLLFRCYCRHAHTLVKHTLML